jgi:hypothetical protein
MKKLQHNLNQNKMKKLIVLVVSLAIWYGAFAFITTEFNPMVWNIWIKLLAVFIAFRVLANVAYDDDHMF